MLHLRSRGAAIAVTATLALSAVLVGCSSGDDEAAARTKLTVCSDIPYEPMEFPAEKGATPSGYTGFDIDLAQQIADKADRTLVVKVTAFDGIFAAMDAGKCDAVVSSVTITDERKQNMAFTAPYFNSDQSILVKKDKAADYATLADLKNTKIGVQSGTTGEEYVKSNQPEGSTITALSGAADLFAALDAGTIDAIVQDYPINAYRATQNNTVVLSERIPTGEQYGIAVKTGNDEVLELFNNGLSAAKADGSYEKLYVKYFGQKPPTS
ncbi:MAG: transporter substrate-binding domain-containing protein [Actinomycetes bacterium]